MRLAMNNRRSLLQLGDFLKRSLHGVPLIQNLDAHIRPIPAMRGKNYHATAFPFESLEVGEIRGRLQAGNVAIFYGCGIFPHNESR
jgi:hypothetical protein